MASFPSGRPGQGVNIKTLFPIPETISYLKDSWPGYDIVVGKVLVTL